MLKYSVCLWLINHINHVIWTNQTVQDDFFFLYILAFLPLYVSQISIMDYRCEPVAPKWMMMIIVSACHICIIPSCPPEIFPIPTGDLHFLYFSFHEDITKHNMCPCISKF